MKDFTAPLSDTLGIAAICKRGDPRDAIVSHFHAIILAVAALKRLNINKQLYTPLNLASMIPAMGQGAIMVQYRLNDHKILDLVHLIHDKDTEICINSEKTIISKLAIGCRIPIGIYAKIKKKNKIWIKTIVGSINGSTIIRSEGKSQVSEAQKLCDKQVQKLIDQGAKKILQSS
uniref:hydroxymethylbilane synthase n=1 Tax=Glossina pallidipes TaxID=7398 RepID=A0A1A9Z1I4_GLOPL